MSYGGLIRILPNMMPSETLATFVHELAHEMLHRAERPILTTKVVRETKAEAVAFVVCRALGLETGTGSADYIQLYHGLPAISVAHYGEQNVDLMRAILK